MANFRCFTLYSFDRREKVELNSYNGYLVSSPTGLGIYINNKYLNLGNKRILTDQKNGFTSLTMSISIFGKTRVEIEEKYRDLRNFISRNRSGGFLLSYLPYQGGEERYIECDIKDFDKGEKETSRYMAIPLTVEPRSFWKVDVKTFSTSAALAREFEFAEDANIENDIVVYNASGQYNGAQSDIPISSSVGIYDKTVLPDDVKISVHCYDSYIKDIVFESNDFHLKSGMLYRAEYNGIDNPNMVYDTTFFCEFNIEQGTFSAGVCFYDYDHIPLSEGTDYTIKKINGVYGKSYDKYIIDFSDDLIDKSCRITGRYIDGDVLKEYNISKQKGKKVVTYTAPSQFYEITGVVDIEKREIPYNDYHGMQIPPSYYWWDINAKIVKGKDNYFASFLEDNGIPGGDYYCIQIGVGKSSAATINNDGDTEVPAVITVFGEAQNPIIILSNKNTGEEVQSTAINLTVPENRQLIISSDPANTGAWVVGGSSATQDVISLLDINTSMFITIPKGEFYIRAVSGSEDQVDFSISFGKEYFGA